MTKEELITKQQLEIEGLKGRANKALGIYDMVTSKSHCVGGPLNDNVLGFTVPQKRWLHELIYDIEELLYKELEERWE